MKSTLFLLVFLSFSLVLSLDANSRSVEYENIKFVYSGKDASNFCLLNECTSTLVGTNTKGLLYLINYLSNVNSLPSTAKARPLTLKPTLLQVKASCDDPTTYCTKVLDNGDSYEVTYYETIDGDPEPTPRTPGDKT